MTDQDLSLAARERVKNLPIWQGPVEPERLTGGITNNNNFVVKDGGERFVVRIGERHAGAPDHALQRARSEQGGVRSPASRPRWCTASRACSSSASSRAGRAPAPICASQACLQKVVPLIKRVHRQPARSYPRPGARLLGLPRAPRLRPHAGGGGSRYASRMPELMDVAAGLGAGVGRSTWSSAITIFSPPISSTTAIAALAVDWDYAGSQFAAFRSRQPRLEQRVRARAGAWMLSTYFGRAPDEVLMRSYGAMKCASLLREAMWGMVSEIYSRLDYDYRRLHPRLHGPLRARLARYSRKPDDEPAGLPRRAAVDRHRRRHHRLLDRLSSCPRPQGGRRPDRAWQAHRRRDLACRGAGRPAALFGVDHPRAPLFRRPLQEARGRNRAGDRLARRPAACGSPATTNAGSSSAGRRPPPTASAWRCISSRRRKPRRCGR